MFWEPEISTVRLARLPFAGCAHDRPFPPDHHKLVAPLSDLGPGHRKTVASVSDLESRLVRLLSRYDDSVSSDAVPGRAACADGRSKISAISETFLDLNDLVSQAEDQVAALEKAKRRKEQGEEL